jgi:predicted metal-dependent hydrolase
MAATQKTKKNTLIKQYVLSVGEKNFTVFVYLENRNDCRASIGAKGIHIRLTKYFNERDRFDQEMQLLDWAKKYIAKNELHKKPPLYRQYRDGDTLKVMGKEFLIRIRYVPEKNASNGSLKNDIIQLQLSEGMSPKQDQKHKTYLVSRLIGNEFQPQIAQRVQYLNDLHFQRPIKKLRLRDSITNWGSCSWDGNINISVRLLFAPPEVIDYVLIHELAHLVEHNHSDRFWHLVEKVMPGYRLAESWLHQHGNQCIY